MEKGVETCRAYMRPAINHIALISFAMGVSVLSMEAECEASTLWMNADSKSQLIEILDSSINPDK